MSVQASQKTTTTYRTVQVASPEPVTSTVISPGPASPLPYSLNGSYETVRYLVPMQQSMQQPLQQQYIPVQQAVQQQSYVLMQQPMMQQPVMQQMVSPVYLHSMPHLSVSSQESDLYLQQNTVEVSPMFSVFSSSKCCENSYNEKQYGAKLVGAPSRAGDPLQQNNMQHQSSLFDQCRSLIT